MSIPATTTDIIGICKEALPTVSVLLARPMAMFTVLPFLDSTVLPGTARNAVIISMTLPVLVTLVPPLMSEPLVWETLLIVLFKEAIIGMLIGFLAGIPFWIAEGIGFVIDNQRGTTLASVFNPLSGETTSPLGILFNITSVALYFASGSFLVFLSLFYRSYFIWPVNVLMPTVDSRYIDFFLGTADHLLRAIALYASPVLIVMFLSDFGLGMMNRFAQQLNVFTISMPVKCGFSLFVLIFYMSYLFGFIKDEFAISYILINELQDVIRFIR